MEKFGFNHFGGPDVFERFDQPQPTPKDNQVLIKVLAAGLNPYDVALRNGSQDSVRPLPFPIFPGTDVVGEIVELGADVDDYRVGEIVINHRSMGAYSEYVTASTAKILRKPASMSIAEAAGLTQCRHHCLQYADALHKLYTRRYNRYYGCQWCRW
ncbi:alcohol dehydrogenase catalytic domain-containing protein [Latilactobacillus curvatus]